MRRDAGLNLYDATGAARDPAALRALRVPSMHRLESQTEATPKRVYSNAHTYHIHSVGLSSDECTFLSADDLRINLWSIARNDETFVVVDVKPENMEDLSEVRPCAGVWGVVWRSRLSR